MSRTSAVAGRAKLLWGCRERQADGSAAEAMRIFFGNPSVFQRALQSAIPASPDARSRESSPPTTEAGTRRISCARKLLQIAYQVFVEAGPRALSAGIVAADDGDEHAGSLQKNSHGPSLRPHHPPNPTFHARCPTRNGEALHLLPECRRTPLKGVRHTITRLARSQIDEEPEGNGPAQSSRDAGEPAGDQSSFDPLIRRRKPRFLRRAGASCRESGGRAPPSTRRPG
jgi:hypothetical protein